MSNAINQNLPIFKKKYIITQGDRFYIESRIGIDEYLGFMSFGGRRKDYFAYVDEYDNGTKVTELDQKSGRLGRLDSMDINRKKIECESGSKIYIEVIHNRKDELTGFIPRLKSGYLVFRHEKIEMSFIDWINFMRK